ncbi:hypothetical protein DK853_49115, partial [Klebsiella oxytoca]
MSESSRQQAQKKPPIIFFIRIFMVILPMGFLIIYEALIPFYVWGHVPISDIQLQLHLGLGLLLELFYLDRV